MKYLSEKEIRRRVKNWLQRKGGHKLEHYPFTESQFICMGELTENDWKEKFNDKNLILAEKVRKIKQDWITEKYNSELSLLQLLAYCKPKEKWAKKIMKLKYISEK